MPFFLYLIRSYYIFLTILIIVVPLKYSIIEFSPSLIIMWGSYFCFKKGTKNKQSNSSSIDPTFYHNASKDRYVDRTFIFFTLFLIAFIPLYIQFYTGSTIQATIISFSSGTGSDSNYGMYQQYFADKNLEVFSFDKLPYIVLNGISKVVFWFFCIYYFAYNRRFTKKTILSFVTIYILFFLSGVSRGTSFENFELLVITVFAILTSQKMKYGIDSFSHKQLVALGSILVLAGVYFVFSKSLRYDDYSAVALMGPTSTLKFDPDAWIMSIIPSIGEAALSFSGYFVFPMYFTSEVFWNIAVPSVEGLLSFILPIMAPLTYNDPGAYRFTLERMGVDCGACWNPDVTTIIYYLGLPIYFVLSYLLGRIAVKQYNKGLNKKNIANTLLLFIISYEMLSLPVGNFLVISSANKISLFIVLYLVYTGHFKRFVQR